MKNFTMLLLTILLFIAGMFNCSFKKPTDVDGACSIYIFVIDTTGIVAPDSISGFAAVADAKVQIYSQDYDLEYTFSTDKNGEIKADNILASKYFISISKKIKSEFLPDTMFANKDVLLAGAFEKTVYQNHSSVVDTISLEKKLISKIVINEIYYCGSNCINGNYKYDQFVELFNASDSVQYLDKLIIARASTGTAYINQFAAAIYVYQFPGTGKNFPVAPGEHIVVAQDAIDHINVAGANCSLDLSNADWEFYNKYGDVDNQFVPNIENINPNFNSDFLLHLHYGGVLLINGKEIDRLKFNSDGYVLFNFKDVMDGIEYSRDPGNPKIFNNKIDAGIAGIGLQKYSGKSIERENPLDGSAGFDSDNSSLNFKIISPPTPGYQHGEKNVLPGNNLLF